MKFVKERCLTSTVSFFEKLPRLKLKTFTSLLKPVHTKSKNQVAAVRTDRSTFARLLIVEQSWSMDMREVMQYNLGPLPYALASPDGSLAKTDKSKLLVLIEGNTSTASAMPRNAAHMPSMACQFYEAR